eukprot:TRINITY_DN5451_c0_g1_i1.p1 TRINITY_DN5451_c0_g1~~TRINITY_DN5451_c0_g1_i1.p1  ORF type:complete len:588 (-),score=114.16 TRINITY_DN5451_c0_g1_i1:46-1776(-)
MESRPMLPSVSKPKFPPPLPPKRSSTPVPESALRLSSISESSEVTQSNQEPAGPSANQPLSAREKKTSALSYLYPDAKIGYRTGKTFNFSEEDNDSNIVFSEKTINGKPTIKYASLDKLISKLTWKGVEPTFLSEFLLTYRSFCTPLELIDGLIQRLDQFKDDPVVPIRVFNVFRTWIDKHWYDFSKDKLVLEKTMELLDNYTTNSDAYSAAIIKSGTSINKTLTNRMKRKEEGARKYNFSTPYPRPVLPVNVGGALQLMDIPAIEVARQMTLIEFDLFTKIQPWEFLGQAWTKADKDDKAPNVVAMISRFNVVSKWIATEICSVENQKKRLKVVLRCIEIAQRLREYNNFNAILEIVSGIHNSSVSRLKSTMESVPKQQQQIFDELRELVAHQKNYDRLRTYLHCCSPPCIPYLGMYLTDLTFIEDANKDSTNGLINYAKRKLQSSVIMEIQQYQQTPYCLESVRDIQDFLLNLKFYDEDTLYRMSCYIEPKEGAVKPEKPPELMSKQERKMLKKSQLEEEELMEFDLEIVSGYPFYDKDSPSNIVFSENLGEKRIIAGTLPKLVERLTFDKYIG